MSINQTCLESEIQTAVDNLTTSCSAEVFLETAIAADNANTDRKFTVALGCQLPDLQTANIPAGTMVYVEELGVPVVATPTAWTGLDGRLYRSDVQAGQLYTAGINNYYALLRSTGSTYQFLREEYSDYWCDTAGGGDGSFAQIFGIKSNGTMWNWGYVCGSALSILNSTETGTATSPIQEISSSTNWYCVDAGLNIGSALKRDGTLWSWGCNTADGTGIRSSSPVQEASSSTNWCKVSTSNNGAAAIKADSTLWAWDSNIVCVAGAAALSSPVREHTSSFWTDISLRSNTNLAMGAQGVKTDGTVWGWGRNCFGQLASNNLTNYMSSPVQEISLSTNWCNITASTNYTAAIKTDGTLWNWGHGNRGAFGDCVTTFSSPVQEICSATNWCLVHSSTGVSAIKTDGTLWGWGQNQCGHTGLGSAGNTCSPVQEFTKNTGWFCVQLYGTIGMAFRCV